MSDRRARDERRLKELAEKLHRLKQKGGDLLPRELREVRRLAARLGHVPSDARSKAHRARRFQPCLRVFGDHVGRISDAIPLCPRCGQEVQKAPTCLCGICRRERLLRA